jgi:hypothetical protein
MPTVSDQTVNVRDHVWNDNTLAWEPYEQPATIGVGGDASASNQLLEIAALGGTTDAEATSNGSIIAVLKRIRTLLASPLSVNVSNASIAVTGTFWQTTQPVSIASMPSTPVTGTFYQVTQPVSLAALPALAAGSAVIGHVVVDTAPTTAVTGPLTDTQLRATPVPISGTVTATTGGLTDTQLRASAVPVSLATVPALVAGSAVIGHVIVDTAPSTAITNANLDAAISTLATASAQTTGNSSLSAIKTAVETIDNFISGARGLVTEDNSAAILSGMATAANQTTGNSSLSTIATNTAPLIYAQGAAAAALVGPMVQSRVNDSPQSYDVDTLQPLSMTADGRLRVSTVISDVNRVWQHTNDDPWTADGSSWEQELSYV